MATELYNEDIMTKIREINVIMSKVELAMADIYEMGDDLSSAAKTAKMTTVKTLTTLPTFTASYFTPWEGNNND